MSRPTSQASNAPAPTRLAHQRSLSARTNTTAAKTNTTTAGTNTTIARTNTTTARTNTTIAVAKPLPNPLPASHVHLFVTNLRLLDLDLRHDWPNVTAQTLSARNADQKQRISGTEWALFRLFEIWDPSDTAQKLRPFFPPLEPLQSLNLRAALYRALNELKKNGVLGRDAVLRKTMLDECKGDRFYEILALFSAAVLKKVLAASGAAHSNPAVARRLATASSLSSDEQRSLLPLAIAHKAALVNVLRRKEETRTNFAAFDATLDAKANDISKRTRRCIDTPRAKRPPVPQREADALKRQLADNWIGDQKWLGVMLHGDQIHAGDAFLGNRFDRVWHMVERGRKLEDAAPEAGLLEELQSRVHEQQTRLHKWKTFHQELRRHGTIDTSVDQKVAVPVKVRFDSHIQHQLPLTKEIQGRRIQHQLPLAEATQGRRVRRPALRSSYQDILSDMDADLSRVSQSNPQPALASLRRRRTSSSAPRSPIRTKPLHSKQTARAPPSSSGHMEPKTLASEPKTLVREQKALFEGLSAASSTMHVHRRSPAKATPIDSDVTLVGQLSSLRIAAPESLATHSPVRRPLQPEPEAGPVPTAASSSPLSSEGSPAPSQPTPFSDPSPTESPPPALSRSIPSLDVPALNAEALADQIINAIGNATPSPVKKPQPRMSMSLVERTRMTLSRTPSFEPVPESPDSLPVAPPTIVPASSNADLDKVTSLLERTRLSMAAMSSRPRAPSRGTAKKQPTSRSSLLPVTHSDTSRKSLEALEEGGSGTKTPREDLLQADVDYDRVFKSRPKIATSPIFSPEKYVAYDGPEENPYEEDITGIDLGDVDQSDAEDEGFTQTLDASPSRRPVRGRY